MVKILPQRGFLAGLEESLPKGLAELIGKTEENKQRKLEDQDLLRLGIDVRGVRDPNIRRQLVDANQKREVKEAKIFDSVQRNDILTNYFGKEFAELHASLNTGEQTIFFEQVLEAKQRGQNPRKLLQKWKEQVQEDEDVLEGVEEDQDILEGIGEDQGAPDQIISPEKQTDIIEEGEIGLTPKEKVAAREKSKQRSFDLNKPYLEKISNISRGLSKEKLALQQMKGAMDAGDFNSFKNVIGEMTGLEFLKTASAQVVNSASKQFLMSSLEDITGRPNAFIEKEITKALISPLYKEEANQLIYEGLEGLHELKKREVEIAQDLQEKYTAKGGEVPRNFQKLVRKQLQKEALEFEKRYEKRVKDLLSSKKGQVSIISPDGQKGFIPKSELEDALDQGYTRG